MFLLLNTTRFEIVEYLEHKYTGMINNGERVNKTVLDEVSYYLTYNKVVTVFCNLYTKCRF